MMRGNWRVTRFCRRLFSVRPGEGGATARLCVYFAATVFASVLVEAAQIALFLSVFGVDRLPRMLALAYLATSVLGTGVALSCTALNAWLGFVRVVRWTLLVAAGAMVASVGLAGTGFKWAVFLLFPLTRVANGVVLNQCWALITEVLDARQSKRLFPLIGAAGELARIVAGWSVGVLLVVLPVAQLMALGGLCVLLPFLFFGLLPASPPPPVSPERRTLRQFAKDSQRGLRTVRAERLLLIVAGLVALTAMVGTFTDYLYQMVLKQRTDIAVFHGQFSVVCGLLSLLLQMLVVPRVFPVSGVGPLALSAPLATTLGGVAIALFPTFYPVVATHLLAVITENAASQPALQLSFAPYPTAKRVPAQTLIYGVIRPFSWFVAAVALVLLPARVGLSELAVLTAGLSLVALGLARRLPYWYRMSLTAALADRRIGLDDFPPGLGQRLDAAQTEFLCRALTSPDTRQVLFALELLHGSPSPEVRAAVTPLLSDSRRQVAVAAAQTLTAFGSAEAATALAAALTQPLSASVAREVLRGLRQLDDHAATEQVARHLNHSDPWVRAEAILYQAAATGAAATVATQMFLASDEASFRAAGAYLVGELWTRDSAEALTRLLDDSNAKVRVAAIRAAAGRDAPQLREGLLQALGDRTVRWEAIRSLAAGGPGVTAWIRAQLGSDELNPGLAAHLPRVLGEIGSESAVAGLTEAAAHPDVAVRHAALASLLRLRRRGVVPLAGALTEGFQREGAEAGFYCLALAVAPTGGPQAERVAFLCDELRNRLHRVILRLFQLLTIRHSRAVIHPLRQRLQSSDPKQQALALELIAGLTTTRTGTWLTALLEPTPPEEKLTALKPLLPAEQARETNLFRLLESRQDPWLRHCAHYAAATGWAAGTSTEEGDLQMLLMERLLFLRQVPLFRGLSGEDLQPVAQVVEEQTFEAGEAVFEQGQAGEGLYLIVGGEVAIRRSGREVARLHAPECFGEMAILDDEPRSADALCLTETRLLHLRRDEFDLLIEQHPGLARNVFPVLTRRLRTLLAEREGERRADTQTPPPDAIA